MQKKLHSDYTIQKFVFLSALRENGGKLQQGIAEDKLKLASLRLFGDEALAISPLSVSKLLTSASQDGLVERVRPFEWSITSRGETEWRILHHDFSYDLAG